MRVIHVDTERGWRGGQRQVLLLATELQSRGVDQILVAPPESRLLDEARRVGIATHPLRQRAEVDPRAARTLRGIALADIPTVVHTHAGHAHALAAQALRRRWDRPLRLVVSRRVDNPLRRSVFSRWKWSAGADRILCVSQAAQREVLRVPWVEPARAVVVYSAVEVPAHLARGAQSTGTRGAGEPTRLVSVGSLVAHKGHETLIRALPLIRANPVDLEIYGDGPLRDGLQRLIDELGLAGRARLAGFVTDVPTRIAAADLFVHPSIGEGLGTSILDAMALGVPVVAADAGGIGEIVFEGTGRLAKPGSPVDLARIIDEALAGPEETRRLAGAAQTMVRERHSIGQLADATLAEYQRALESTPAPYPPLTGYRTAYAPGVTALQRRQTGANGTSRKDEAAGAPIPLPPLPHSDRAKGSTRTASVQEPAGSDPGRENTSLSGRGLMKPAFWNGLACWEKTHRRGGWLGPVRGGFRRPFPRATSTLAAEERARELGLTVPRTVQIEIRKIQGRSYELKSLSEAFDGWSDLGRVLAGPGASPEVCRGLGRTLRVLHDGGVDHRDLNVRNVLVGPSHSVALIDFDPASVGAPLNRWTRRRRLGRLQRSLLKTIGRSEPTFSLILEGYGDPGLWGRMQQVSARLMGSVHALLWERA